METLPYRNPYSYGLAFNPRPKRTYSDDKSYKEACDKHSSPFSEINWIHPRTLRFGRRKEKIWLIHVTWLDQETMEIFCSKFQAPRYLA